MAPSGKNEKIASLAQDPPAPAADGKGKQKTKEISQRVIASDAQTPPSSSANNKKKTDVKSTRKITSDDN
ncbi:hypothetical protein L6164_008968 [Bauhinia variegata]|uniref:Uncharacterized protein n=1 Tax=Bauhinia variegata TaxID=167791 RepID=A0ACB9PHJ2_BAUVA|nr:hypothetical protein L6164_008968 [Bauhinia variegata]